MPTLRYVSTDKTSSTLNTTKIGSRPASSGVPVSWHRHSGQIRDQHRHNELHRLHLAQLPLAHEPDDEDQRQI